MFNSFKFNQVKYNSKASTAINKTVSVSAFLISLSLQTSKPTVMKPLAALSASITVQGIKPQVNFSSLPLSLNLSQPNLILYIQTNNTVIIAPLSMVFTLQSLIFSPTIREIRKVTKHNINRINTFAGVK